MFVIADNQALTSKGFEQMLSGLEVRHAANRRELAALLSAHPTAGVILDYGLFDFEGIPGLLVTIRRFASAHWLMVAAEFNHDLLQLLSSEARVSFLTKDSGADQLHSAIEALKRGERTICQAVAEQLTAHTPQAPDRLTPAETEVLRLIARGMTAREIAEARHSSFYTVTTHKKNLFRKLGVSTAYEATRYAIRAGLADPVEYYI
ncbi:MAG: response regulator transcription factor [Alloprevotella sp.]|nr:response regulator transcription factor [Alloprevotella sp.]